MKVLAITDKRYLPATLEVVGGEADVLVSPPIRASDVDPAWLRGYDLLYLDLHGKPGNPRLWSGEDEMTPALDVRTVQRADLAGTVVFATSCYLPATPFVKAFLKAGARAVVAGRGANYGGRTRVTGAQVLGRLFVRSLAKGRKPERALAAAKRTCALRAVFTGGREREALRDAIEFEVWSGR